ncbi:hypothetical protein MCOR25_004132 [Pyricularia grisea]|nr:hypothetical protein MCOR25_004132 [Pyricularia grisea]
MWPFRYLFYLYRRIRIYLPFALYLPWPRGVLPPPFAPAADVLPPAACGTPLRRSYPIMVQTYGTVPGAMGLLLGTYNSS